MANWHLDEGWHLDWEEQATLVGEFELSIDYRIIERPLTDVELVIESEIDIDFIHAISLDLLPLIPEKFHANEAESQILRTYVKEVGFRFGDVLTKTKDIVKLLSPNTTGSAQYLRLLGALIGIKFPPEDETSVAELRKILSQAIDWYKVKGTYRSIEIILNVLGYKVNLYDMYTNDYSNFVLTDWFVGNEDENPPGLNSSYYKSPHFGLEIILNKVFQEGSLNYLWYRDYLDNIKVQVEETRPVHTVPHYLLLLNPKTDERGNLITVSGDIKAKITGNWEYSTKYFDAVNSGEKWNFDDGSMIFDASEESYIKGITKWVLGTGNYPCQIAASDADIQIPALTGSIALDDITITNEKYEFEFIVPKSTVQYGISELGLYIPGSPDKLVLLSCFPKIDKTDDTELRVVVEIFKEDLSV